MVNYLLASNSSDESFKLVDDNVRKGGPWCEANTFILESQNHINEILKHALGKFIVKDIDFSCSETLTLNQDLENLFNFLDTVDQEHRNVVNYIKAQLEGYISRFMNPNLLQLEMILLLQAFHFKGKPIIDVFYDYNEKNKRVFRTAERFCGDMESAYMSLFYKLAYLILLKKQSIEVENAEVFSMLQNSDDRSIPSCTQFGFKAHSDSTVGSNATVVSELK